MSDPSGLPSTKLAIVRPADQTTTPAPVDWEHTAVDLLRDAYEDPIVTNGPGWRRIARLVLDAYGVTPTEAA